MVYAWRDLWARPEQIEPEGDWSVWLILAGRGFGKTRTGAEWVREQVERNGVRRIAGVAATAADARDVMVEGDSGILAVSRPNFYPHYEPSKRRVTWPNGAILTLFSSEEPNRLRGPQHERFWADEAASWKNGPESWDNLMFGLRLGDNPRGIVTTTPRPVRIMRDMVKDPDTVITGGSTYDNAANLAPKALRLLQRKYEGTTLGQQELHARLLTEMPGAMWLRKTIEDSRIPQHLLPPMVRIVIAIDPAVSSSEESDETGIIVAGLGTDNHGYVLWDGSMRGRPAEWAARALFLYEHYTADRIVAEVNNGGEMVESTLRTVNANVSYRAIHAAKGKVSRAEPVAALYEQGRVHHLILPDNIDPDTGRSVPVLEDVEDQMCTYVRDSEDSPDRMDALVYAITELMLDEDATERYQDWDEGYRISDYDP